MPQKSLIARRAFRFGRQRLAAGEEFLASGYTARAFIACGMAREKHSAAEPIIESEAVGLTPAAPVIQAPGHEPPAPDHAEPNNEGDVQKLAEPTHAPATEENCEQRIDRALEGAEVQNAAQAEPPAGAPRKKRAYRRRDIAPTETKE